MLKETKKPWGSYTELYEDADTKVKIITIQPGQAPSYQYHFKRTETWVVVRGKGTLKKDGESTSVEAGMTIFIPKEAKHQITNTGTTELMFVEIQMGEYFGEDDIVRIDDKYGRH